ncbi:MAG TPA: lytic murein transglycosylase [Solirubrobacteraceae bacterium]|jgi:murein DD-endopeptidase MepM/ murein hydrolase activator NlpD|nr:lytic murein transglycosylase [Solirubrobacteraceae bacterium]
MNRRTAPRRSLAAAVFVLGLAVPATALATEEAATSTPPAATSPATTEAPAPTVTSTIESPPTPAPKARKPRLATPPQIQAQHPQGATPASKPAGKGAAGKPGANAAAEAAEQARAENRAPSPAALTPSLPFGLETSISGVPGFFIESFRIPPFLLPIYQAAGTANGIPWQVLAAINEVETDYGRDVSVSSAGAEGWMQFLPSSWSQYGVDANGDGYMDPYNPADAIFAAARYLRAAGGQTNIRSAIYAYNHSQAYVGSVMLRAQLLGGTPSELLGAITGLTEARFPVHAVSHFSDGFPLAPAPGGSAKLLPGTTIYSQPGAPVIAVQDGEVVQLGSSPSLGRFVTLRDAYGNTYTYAELGDVASLYPVLQPHPQSTVSRRIAQPAVAEPPPSGPATAGAQPRSPISAGAAVSGFAEEAAASLEHAQGAVAAQRRSAAPPLRSRSAPRSAPHVFREGVNDVYLHALRPGAQVISGTVLGHLGSTGDGGPHMLFQIRPAGTGAPLIDPKPILDGWVALENSSIFRAKGENPFLATSPTVGQVLLESKQQLEPQVLHDANIRLSACGRQDVQTGRVDRRVLAMLAYLSVSGLGPTVAGLGCAGAPAAGSANAAAGSTQTAIDISAINATPVAGHQAPGSIADTAVRRLLMLEGATRPREIVSLMSYPGAAGALTRPNARNAIHVTFTPPAAAHGARAFGSALTPDQWVRLVARLGEIPDPTVESGPSQAAIPAAPTGGGNGHH